MIRWLEVHAGLTNGAGGWYLWWSGIAGDAWLMLPLILYRKHNCHVHRCWRIGKHPLEGTPYVLCAKHHPAVERLTKEKLDELA